MRPNSATLSSEPPPPVPADEASCRLLVLLLQLLQLLQLLLLPMRSPSAGPEVASIGSSPEVASSSTREVEASRFGQRGVEVAEPVASESHPSDMDAVVDAVPLPNRFRVVGDGDDLEDILSCPPQSQALYTGCDESVAALAAAARCLEQPRSEQSFTKSWQHNSYADTPLVGGDSVQDISGPV